MSPTQLLHSSLSSSSATATVIENNSLNNKNKNVIKYNLPNNSNINKLKTILPQSSSSLSCLSTSSVAATIVQKQSPTTTTSSSSKLAMKVQYLSLIRKNHIQFQSSMLAQQTNVLKNKNDNVNINVNVNVNDNDNDNDNDNNNDQKPKNIFFKNEQQKQQSQEVISIDNHQHHQQQHNVLCQQLSQKKQQSKQQQEQLKQLKQQKSRFLQLYNQFTNKNFSGNNNTVTNQQQQSHFLKHKYSKNSQQNCKNTQIFSCNHQEHADDDGYVCINIRSIDNPHGLVSDRMRSSISVNSGMGLKANKKQTSNTRNTNDQGQRFTSNPSTKMCQKMKQKLKCTKNNINNINNINNNNNNNSSKSFVKLPDISRNCNSNTRSDRTYQVVDDIIPTNKKTKKQQQQILTIQRSIINNHHNPNNNRSQLDNLKNNQTKIITLLNESSSLSSSHKNIPAMVTQQSQQQINDDKIMIRPFSNNNSSNCDNDQFNYNYYCYHSDNKQFQSSQKQSRNNNNNNNINGNNQLHQLQQQQLQQQLQKQQYYEKCNIVMKARSKPLSQFNVDSTSTPTPTPQQQQKYLQSHRSSQKPSKSKHKKPSKIRMKHVSPPPTECQKYSAKNISAIIALPSSHSSELNDSHRLPSLPIFQPLQQYLPSSASKLYKMGKCITQQAEIFQKDHQQQLLRNKSIKTLRLQQKQQLQNLQKKRNKKTLFNYQRLLKLQEELLEKQNLGKDSLVLIKRSNQNIFNTDNQVVQEFQQQQLEYQQQLQQSQTQPQDLDISTGSINLAAGAKKTATGGIVDTNLPPHHHQSRKRLNPIIKKKEQQLSIYETRIKSYQEFLFMMNFSRKLYHLYSSGAMAILKPSTEIKNIVKYKFFIGRGNNKNLIKSLMKRRFWWEETEHIEKAHFVWTQLKINSIYEKQPTSQYKNKEIKDKFDKSEDIIIQSQSSKKQQNFSTIQPPPNHKRSCSSNLSSSIQSSSCQCSSSDNKPQKSKFIHTKKFSPFTKNQKKKKILLLPSKQKQPPVSKGGSFKPPFLSQQPAQMKIFTSVDRELFKNYQANLFKKNNNQNLQNVNRSDENLNNQQNILQNKNFSSQNNNTSTLTIVTPITGPTPLHLQKVHNHFESNYFIGNKKALFYNLRNYYKLLGMNPFQMAIPFTLHIKQGMKDPAYSLFVKQYKRIASAMTRTTRSNNHNYSSTNPSSSSLSQYSSVKSKNLWIVKPGQLSNRGSGITVIDEIYELNSILKRKQKHTSNNTQKSYILQKYIERPLLYKGRKFDIRHFMLIQRINGRLRAYFYSQGYIRTSSYEYNLDQLDEMIHLTNDAIQNQDTQYGKHQEGNKVSYNQFQRYLNLNKKIGAKNCQPFNFSEKIYPQMKRIATDVVKSTYLQIDTKCLQHNFQLFGMDFMIDSEYKVWLIQVNTNPCYEISSSKLLQRIIPQVCENTLRMCLDPLFPPFCHYPNSMKHFCPDNPLERLQYQLIFDQARDGKQIEDLFARCIISSDIENNKNDMNNTNKCLQEYKQRLVREMGGQLGLQEDQVFDNDGKQLGQLGSDRVSSCNNYEQQQYD